MCERGLSLSYCLNHAFSILTSHFTHWPQVLPVEVNCYTKTSTGSFFLHNFTNTRCVPTIDLSRFSSRFFFFSLLSEELFLNLKTALYSLALEYLNGQHHYSCFLGMAVKSGSLERRSASIVCLRMRRL